MVDRPVHDESELLHWHQAYVAEWSNLRNALRWACEPDGGDSACGLLARRCGVDPGLLDEVSWWRTDDLWFRALEALVTYVRAAAEHGAEPVTAICGRVASRHGVQLAPAT